MQALLLVRGLPLQPHLTHKLNHFKDWLSQFQAKENTQIPEEVLDAVRLSLRSKGIKNFSSITPKRVQKELKELQLPKYYEHRTGLNFLLIISLSAIAFQAIRHRFLQVSKNELFATCLKS